MLAESHGSRWPCVAPHCRPAPQPRRRCRLAQIRREDHRNRIATRAGARHPRKAALAAARAPAPLGAAVGRRGPASDHVRAGVLCALPKARWRLVTPAQTRGGVWSRFRSTPIQNVCRRSARRDPDADRRQRRYLFSDVVTDPGEIQSRRSAQERKKPRYQGFLSAPEWTRTITGKSPHKALNLARLPIPPRAQRGRV
jgi:hypothetical protein